MSDNDDDLDNIIVYEFVKDCDSVENEEFQNIYIREQKEEEEEEEQQLEEELDTEKNDSRENSYVIASNIEVLEDEDILQEHMLQSFADPEFEEEEEEEEVEVDNDVAEETAEKELSEKKVKKEQTPTKTQKKTENVLQRYMLFDDLVATVVDYEEDGTAIVKFSKANASDMKLPIECGVCPDVMPKSKLAEHLKTHLVPGSNRYKCIYCSETYKDYKYLASHARRHMGIRPYVCETCKLYFSTKQDMRVHNQRRHLEKEHICEICGKTFSQNTMLKRHRESTHEKKRRYCCEFCPKAYYKNFSLKEHVRSVHMGERRMLKCPFCGMQCVDAHKMARHRKLWHLNQNKFECDVCQESFTNVHYFDAHKRSIQCRNNTRRKEEEELKKQQEKQQQEQQENNVNVEDVVIETAAAEEVNWQLEDGNTVEEEVYDSADQYVEFVLPEQEAQDTEPLILEISLPSN